MPEKELQCAGCNAFLGTVEKGNMRKDITFLCGTCDNKRRGALMKMEALKHDKPKGYEDLFGNLFK